MAGLLEKWYRARRNAEGGRVTKSRGMGSRPQLKRKRPAAAGALDLGGTKGRHGDRRPQTPVIVARTSKKPMLPSGCSP
jgi:hypothetical protein